MADVKDKKDDGNQDDLIEGLTQAKFEKVIADAFARGAANGADPKKLKETETALETLQAEHKAAQEELKKLQEAATTKKPGDEGSGTDQNDQLITELRNKVESLTADFSNQIEALNAATAEERAKREASEDALALEGLRNQVIRTAGGLDVHDAGMVFTLMDAAGMFKKNDSGMYQVVDPDTGKPRIDVSVEGAGQPLGVDSATKEFIDQRQFLVKSSGRTGSGQGAGTGNGSGDAQQKGNLPSLPEGVDPMNLKPSQLAAHGAAIRAYREAGGEVRIEGAVSNAAT